MHNASKGPALVPLPGSVPLARILVQPDAALSTPTELLLLKLKTSCAPTVPTSRSARWPQPAHEALLPFDAGLKSMRARVSTCSRPL